MRIDFTKASGAGNDFIIIDNRGAALPADHAALARTLCDRHFGIGADGLLLLENSPAADFAMRYYNSDGSYGGMCGNGGRCLARYAHLKGVAGVHQKFTALDHAYTAEVKGEIVALSMKDPRRTALGSGFRFREPLWSHSISSTPARLTSWRLSGILRASTSPARACS